jgi:hypothetical protein
MIIDVQPPIAAKRAASLLKHWSLNMYELDGTIADKPFKVLVADDGSTLSYIKSLAFDEEPKVTRRGRISALAASSLSNAAADLVVVGANCLAAGSYARMGFHIVPKWVRLFLPTTEEPYARLYEFGRQTRKYFKWMLKKARDEQFACEMIRDPAWFDRFYDEMYYPYALSKFGEQAIVHVREKVRKAFFQGAVAIVRRGEDAIAGEVVLNDGKTLAIRHFGAAQNSRDAFRDGAAFALDYFVVELAHSKGYEYVDFGHSRAFLSDGILRYKLNWHMEVRDDDDAIGVFAIATPGSTPAATEFLAANPFYELAGRDLKVFHDGSEADEDSD